MVGLQRKNQPSSLFISVCSGCCVVVADAADMAVVVVAVCLAVLVCFIYFCLLIHSYILLFIFFIELVYSFFIQIILYWNIGWFCIVLSDQCVLNIFWLSLSLDVSSVLLSLPHIFRPVGRTYSYSVSMHPHRQHTNISSYLC